MKTHLFRLGRIFNYFTKVIEIKFEMLNFSENL